MKVLNCIIISIITKVIVGKVLTRSFWGTMAITQQFKNYMEWVELVIFKIIDQLKKKIKSREN